MTHGRKVCNTLKEIRRQIADKNEIEYATDDCRFEGECKGTCPKCDAEVKYLENELHKRKLLGKTAAIAGISLGIAGTFSACNTSQQKSNTTSSKQEIAADTVNLDTMPVIPKDKDSVKYGYFPNFELEGFVIDDWLDDEPTLFEPEIVVGEMELQPNNDEDIFVGLITETLPEYPGGEEARMKFLKENLIYPQEAKEKKIAGRVFVSFIVETDGSLSNFEVVRGVHPLLDAEALRVAKLMPNNWTSGKQRGKAVRTQFQIPITFTLDDE